MDDEFYTLEEIAERLKVVYMTVYRWVKSGKLPAYKFGKQYRIKKNDIQKFIENSKKVNTL